MDMKNVKFVPEELVNEKRVHGSTLSRTANSLEHESKVLDHEGLHKMAQVLRDMVVFLREKSKTLLDAAVAEEGK